MKHLKKWRTYLVPIVILFAVSCIDRVFIEIEGNRSNDISVYGYISDAPGPYKIEVQKSFDIESKVSLKTPFSVKRVTIFDNEGTLENLVEVSPGVYQTQINGIRGQIGNAYQVRIEFFDGRIYESIPDTLYPKGQLDSVYYTFRKEVKTNGVLQYGFDVLANSSPGNLRNNRFLWRFVGTFQADTHPEIPGSPPGQLQGCFYYRGKCNFVPPCSGLVNVGGYTILTAVYEREKPCECCTCWYSMYSSMPVLSDALFSHTGNVNGIYLHTIPVDYWVFMHKIHVQVEQISLSRKSYNFWKAIRDQKEASGSLFQPITGLIPNNFIQQEGEPTPINGLFYSVAKSSKAFYIERDDVPIEGQSIIEPIPGLEPTWNFSCTTLFPNSVTTKPTFWVD